MNDPSAVRQRIIAEATRLFVERGYLGISMREIAEASGLSKAGLYYHFKDKADLFLAILISDLEVLGATVAAARAAGSTTRQQVAALIRALLARAPEQRVILRLASQDLPHLDGPARERFRHVYYQQFIGQIGAMLADGMARGELVTVDAHSATWLLLGMLYPFFTSEYYAALPSELIVRVFFDGLGTGR